MPLDAICLSALKNELAEKVCGMKIDKVQQPEKDIILLSLRGQGTNAKLLISAGTGSSRIHLTDEKYDNPITAPMFCMFLRKHLTGAVIAGITQPPMERILDIELNAFDAMGMPLKKHIIVELMGRASNFIVTDEQGVIADCIRRSGSAIDSGRSVLPGLYYRQPPAMNKKIITELNDGEIADIIINADANLKLDKLLLNIFAGFSPLVCRELSYRAYKTADIRIYECINKDRGNAAVNECIRLRDMLLNERFEPYLLHDDNGRPYDFSFMNIQQYAGMFESEKVSSFSALLEAYYTRQEKADRVKQKAKNLKKAVKNTYEKTLRKLESQRKELLNAENREELRQNADIIMANIYAIKRGMRSFSALNFYAEEETRKEIPLDPKKNAQQNAAKYYKEYAKAKNAEKHLTALIAEGEKEAEYLGSVLEALEMAENEHDLAEIRQELSDGGYIRKQQTSKKEKRIEQRPMQFVSSTGIDILVGKNNTQNDLLTMKIASKRDMWLHAQKIHGSHVIIRCNGIEPDEKTIEEAANLAGYYSQGRENGRVPVDFTYVKFVKKPSGAKPGMVIYTDYKTIITRPEVGNLKRIK